MSSTADRSAFNDRKMLIFRLSAIKVVQEVTAVKPEVVSGG